MDGGRIIACDTPEALIRSLPQDAVVKATSAKPVEWSSELLGALPGATHCELDQSEGGTTIRIGTADVQATITAFLTLADNDDVRLGNLASTSANLEDVFLTLTGRSYTDEDTQTNEGDAA